MLDSVTLIRYTTGTVKNCESGGAPWSGRPFSLGDGVARKPKLTLVAAKKPQRKKRAKRDWSKAKAARFLAVLADTCNVSEACRRSGVLTAGAKWMRLSAPSGRR